MVPDIGLSTTSLRENCFSEILAAGNRGDSICPWLHSGLQVVKSAVEVGEGLPRNTTFYMAAIIMRFSVSDKLRPICSNSDVAGT